MGRAWFYTTGFWSAAQSRSLLGPLGRIPHGDALLFMLTSAQVMYGYVIRPDSLEPGYCQCSPHPHTLSTHPRIPKRTLNAISFAFLVRSLCYFGRGSALSILNERAVVRCERSSELLT